MPEPGPERLQKLIARAGVASRRAAEELLRAGRVTVNGRVAELGERAGPGDDVRVDGRPLAAPQEHRTLLLHKPRGVLTTAADDRGRTTVLDLLPGVPGLHPVGRLDLDSEGLLLLSTDGDLTLELTHPRYGHDKMYRVWCSGGTPPSPALRALERGLLLDDGPTAPAGVTPAPGGLYLTLGEGRNRQVRRMLEAVGHPVRRLLRVRFGGLWLGELHPGEWRELDEQDLHELRHPEVVPPHDWDRAAERTRRLYG